MEVRIVVTVPVTVAGSITSSRGREEPEPDLLSLQVCQPGLLARVVHGRKPRRYVALFEHCFYLLVPNMFGLLQGRQGTVSPSGPSSFPLHDFVTGANPDTRCRNRCP